MTTSVILLTYVLSADIARLFVFELNTGQVFLRC